MITCMYACMEEIREIIGRKENAEEGKWYYRLYKRTYIYMQCMS